MAQNNVTEILQAVVGELKDMARSETIIGEPVMAGDKTLVPVVTISVGFGAGGGQGDTMQNGGAGFGGGGGAGLRIEPSAFIVLEREGVSLLPARRGAWENLINAIPNAVDKIAKLRQDMRSRQGQTGSEYEQGYGGQPGEGGQFGSSGQTGGSQGPTGGM